MAYASMWGRLSESRNSVMKNTRCTQEEVETDICRALEDGAIRFRGELKLHTTKRFTARGTVLEGTAFQLPTQIDRGDLDWEESSPRQPWIVKRGHYPLPGYWQLERISLYMTDVRRVLCTAGAGGNAIQRDFSESDTAGKVKLASSAVAQMDPEQGTTEKSPDQPISGKRRGRRPEKLAATIEAMRQDIFLKRISASALADMLEKNLAEKYRVSRDTARKARKAALLEIQQANSRQKPTIDN